MTDVVITPSKLDWARTLMLLSVVREAALHGAAYTSLVSEANAELIGMNKIAAQEATARAKKAAEAQAEADAIEAQRVAKLAEEAAKTEEQQKEAKAKAEADEKARVLAGKPLPVADPLPPPTDDSATVARRV